MEKLQWKTTGRGNSVLQSDDVEWGHISYNPSAPVSFYAMALAPSVGGLEETALVIYEDGETKYRILNGDFRKEYEEVWPNKESCKKVFEKNINHKSDWSTNE